MIIDINGNSDKKSINKEIRRYDNSYEEFIEYAGGKGISERAITDLILKRFNDAFDKNPSDYADTRQLFPENAWDALDVLYEYYREHKKLDHEGAYKAAAKYLGHIVKRTLHVDNVSEYSLLKPGDVRGELNRYKRMPLSMEHLDNSVEDADDAPSFEKYQINTPAGRRELEVRNYDAVACSEMHSKIQRELADFLKKSGYNLLGVETPHGGSGNSRIDVVAEKNGRKIYYEVKPYENVRACIREALGQLLEYRHYGKNTATADSLIIVGPEKASTADTKYINELQETYSMPVKYMQFDLEARCLIEI